MADFEDSSSKVVWFLAGAAIGAAIALLYAPQSGKHTRRQIGSTAERASDTVTGAGREVFDRGREIYEKGKDLADDAADLFERGRKLARG